MNGRENVTSLMTSLMTSDPSIVPGQVSAARRSRPVCGRPPSASDGLRCLFFRRSVSIYDTAEKFIENRDVRLATGCRTPLFTAMLLPVLSAADWTLGYI